MYVPMYILYRAVIILIGAVLKKIKILGFGGPGLKIHAPKEHRARFTMKGAQF